MFNVLNRYLNKIIFTNIIITLFILVSTSGIIKFIDQLKKTGQGNYDSFGALIYTFLSIPRDLQIFSPMAVLLGSLLGLGILSQHNELLAIQASGFTRAQLVLSVMKLTIPLVLFIMIISEWIAPWGEEIAYNYRTQAIYNNSLFSNKRGLWMKDNNSFVYIEHIRNNKELDGITIYEFNNLHRLQIIRYASFAKFDICSKLWLLLKVNESDLTNSKQIVNSKISSIIWKTNLTPNKLSMIILDPDKLSIRGLYSYIKYLDASKQNSERYQLSMWCKVLQPFSITVMMLLALSFIFGPLRNVMTSVRLIIGISFGFIFYMLDQILGPLILANGISPMIGALLPSVSFFLVSLWLLIKHN